MQQHNGGQPAGAQVEVAVRAFRMLSGATRLRLLWALAHGDYDVGNAPPRRSPRTPPPASGRPVARPATWPGP
ncbi:hypothetical protein ACIBP6_10395 [Nonomuraea terrae]|uniref:hypothetical protein n=1 Tax=Nonomuraea terrae TaxID=2530383 RepID=UPI0037ACC052